MGKDTLEDNFTKSFGKEGRRKRFLAVTCEGGRERERASVGGRIE
jgi:hypothetical protein